jgi:uncharacterized protein YaiL (DUF2058 family)
MASLQDQLLKAGMVDKKKAKQIAQQKKKQAKQQAKQQPKGSQVINETREQAQKLIENKKAQGQASNLVRKKENDIKAINAQIKQLITLNTISRKNGEIPFQFVDNKKIKKIYLNESQQIGVVDGRLAIVKLEQAYELVPAAVADKINQRDNHTVVLQNIISETSTADASVDSVDEDDPYADFVVPDDLMW